MPLRSSDLAALEKFASARELDPPDQSVALVQLDRHSFGGELGPATATRYLSTMSDVRASMRALCRKIG
jgi:hypothetical protein